MKKTVSPSRRLAGVAEIPGDKSISHRAMIFGAIASGRTIARNLLDSGDVHSTQGCLRAMGVKITVVITDNDSASTPTALTKVSITAGPATTVNEGQDAVASYTLSGPLAAEAKVNVVALGWDAIPNQDYDGNTLHFRLKVGTTWGNWQTTPNLSEITLAQGTTAFEVKTATLTDTVTPEATETMQFVVSQTAAYSHVLENSWWQSALVGIKDAAYILGSSTGAVTEDGALSASGTLTVFDGDAGEAEFQPLASATGTYGALNLTTAGNWTYTLNNASPAVQALNTGDVRTETFTATSKDGSATQAITVTVNGASDLAVIAGTAIGTVTEDAAQSTATGTLTISDADANEAEFLAQTNQAGAYGLFSVNTAGLWTYTLDNSKPAVQALKGGENKTETFAVSSKDSSAAQAITVTVNGANDVAVISGTTTGTVTEDAAQDTATGLLIITDADAGEAVFQAQTGVMGAYGNFTLNTEGSWTYELDNNKPAVQSLRSNQTVSDVFAVHSLDGFTQRIISIEIIGSSDDVIGVDKLDFNGFTTANPLSVYQGFRMTASSGVLYGSPEAWTAWVVNPSFPGVVYNGNGARFAYLEKVDASNFSIDKLDISQFVSSSPAGDVTFTGYSNNLEIYNQSIHLSSSMQTINLDFENIDVFEVEVNSGPYSGSGWWLIDNIWYV